MERLKWEFLCLWKPALRCFSLNMSPFHSQMKVSPFEWLNVERPNLTARNRTSMFCLTRTCFVPIAVSHFLFISLCISDELARIYISLEQITVGFQCFCVTASFYLSPKHPRPVSEQNSPIGYPSMELCSTSAFYLCALIQKNWNSAQSLMYCT